MSTANGDRPFTSSTQNRLKSVLMNWLTFKLILFGLFQICATAGTTGPTLIGPEGFTVGAAAFIIDTN